MKIYLNGSLTEMPENSTVADILVLLDVVGRRVAVELNDNIVPKSQHSQAILQDNDKVEVVHAIGGG
ncbi:MAG: sulfur carrier protein ThiS [Agitococcus sp.]|nr:sulfur carrier protein ThiS [Agitococcus sp.]